MNNFFRLLVCIAMCALVTSEVLFSVSTASAQQAAAPQTARVNSDAVRAREAADLTSSIVFSLARGVVVEVLARDGVWSRIRSAQRVGWVRANVLTAVESASPAVTPVPPTAAPSASAPQTTPPRSSVTPPPTTPPQTTPAAAPPNNPPPATSQSTPPASQQVAPPRAEASASASPKPAPVVGETRASPSHLFAAGASYTPAPDAGAGAVVTEGGAHVAGHLVMQLSKGPVGVFGMGGMGTGTGYKSQLANAGVSVALLRATRWRLDVVGGGAYYTETLEGAGQVADKATGAMAGGMLTFPLIGPLRGNVLASYMLGKWAEDSRLHSGDARFLRIIVGIGF